MRFKIREYWPSILALLLLVFLFFTNYKDAYAVCVLNDEFGYWGNAATMAGMNWQSLLAQTPYYSMGYSLILVPLFWLGWHPVTMYKAAVLMNMGFLCVSYLCAAYTAHKLFPKIHMVLIQFISAAVVLSGVFLFYSQIAWCEVFLMMLFWCLTALFVRLEDHFSYIAVIGVILCVLAIYLVHQRSILVMAIAVCVLLFDCIRNKKFVFTAIVVVILAVGLMGYRYLHAYQIDQIYSASSYSDVNNVELSSSFVGGYFDRLWENLGVIAISFLCKLGVVMLTTFFALFMAWREYFQEIRAKEFTFFGVKTLILLSVLVMLGLSSIQMFAAERRDLAVYSRYMDFVLPEAALLGLGVLLQYKKKHSRLYSASILITIPLLALSMWRIDQAEGEFNLFCSPLWGAALELFDYQDFIRAGVVLIAACAVVFIIYQLVSRARLPYGKVFLLILFILGNLAVFRFSNDRTIRYRDRVFGSAYEVFELLSDDPSAAIYTTMGPSEDTRVKELQFLLYDRPITVVERLRDIPEEHFYLVTNHELEGYAALKYCGGSDLMDLYYR